MNDFFACPICKICIKLTIHSGRARVRLILLERIFHFCFRLSQQHSGQIMIASVALFGSGRNDWSQLLISSGARWRKVLLLKGGRERENFWNGMTRSTEVKIYFSARSKKSPFLSICLAAENGNSEFFEQKKWDQFLTTARRPQFFFCNKPLMHPAERKKNARRNI
jgi:hypothetical protein